MRHPRAQEGAELSLRSSAPEIFKDRVTSEVIDSSMLVLRALGPFYEASVYRNALVVELRRRGTRCNKNVALSVNYKGEIVGSFTADVLVEDEILLKISAENLLDARFREQVLRGLGASGLRLGLLLDFGGDELRFCRIL